ncbi:hypothetical protein BJ878DRAFT_397373, partial [Calycina marina]
LPMSETKAKFMRHLHLTPEIYAKMGREVDDIYNWLISDPAHLKTNGRRNPPYDWSDISERAKDDAISWILSRATTETQSYWALAQPSDSCENWIARWFLYHKFRYRDGRSRSGQSTQAASYRS